MDDQEEDNLYEHPAFQREVLRRLRRIEEALGALDETEEQLVTDVTALTGAIDKLDADEVAAVAELHTLAETIKGLEAGNVTQAQIDELTTHATAVASALEAGTAAP